MRINRMKRWVIASVILCVVGIFMIIYGVIRDDYNHYWMIMVGLMIFLTFFICFFIFIRDARRIEDIFKEKNILAHWIFSEYEKEDKSEKIITEQKKRNKSILLIISLFFVLFIVLFDIFAFDDTEEALMFTEMMLAILVIVSLAAYFSPIAARKRMGKSVPEVYVGIYDAWVMGEYVRWKNRFRNVRTVQIDDAIFIEVSYFIRQRYGVQNHVLNIPVPSEYIEDAQRFVQDIHQANKYKRF